MVLRQPIAGNQAAVALTVVGAPLFVAEVVSTSTLRNDQEGKRIAYALGSHKAVILQNHGLAGPLIAADSLLRKITTSFATIFPGLIIGYIILAVGAAGLLISMMFWSPVSIRASSGLR